jgi:predicted esterase
MPRPILTVLATVLSLSALLPAQSLAESRHDLGLRLRRLERRFADAGAAPERAAASAAMQRAVGSFFAMNLAAASRALDEGLAALDRGLADPIARRLLSLAVRPSSRLIAAGTAVELRLGPAYEADEWPVELQPRFRVEPGFGSFGRDAMPRTLTLSGATFDEEGDHRLRVEAAAAEDAAWREIATVQVAVVRDLEARLEALGRAAAAARGPELEAGTLDQLHRLLRGLARGEAAETDLPAARLLREAEELARATDEADRHYGDDRPGQFWLRVPVGRRQLPVRIQVPARPDGDREPRPLVLALHGAGGSENLFFDGYGDGLIARLAAARGWYLVAPRAMPAGSAAALVEALAERFAIDRGQIHCVGHSMGAMTAVAAAQEHPGLFARVAARGGGGRVRDPGSLADLPFLVGVGDRDFALGQARALARSLEGGARSVELRVYPGIEHMLVVQVALPDVFAFFDR